MLRGLVVYRPHPLFSYLAKLVAILFARVCLMDPASCYGMAAGVLATTVATMAVGTAAGAAGVAAGTGRQQAQPAVHVRPFTVYGAACKEFKELKEMSI